MDTHCMYMPTYKLRISIYVHSSLYPFLCSSVRFVTHPPHSHAEPAPAPRLSTVGLRSAPLSGCLCSVTSASKYAVLRGRARRARVAPFISRCCLFPPPPSSPDRERSLLPSDEMAEIREIKVGGGMLTTRYVYVSDCLG